MSYAGATLSLSYYTVFYNDVLFVCVRYIAAHLVGRRLIYPGSLLLLNIAVGVFYISRFNIEFLCVVSE